MTEKERSSNVFAVRECTLITELLIGRQPSQEVVDRYCYASGLLFSLPKKQDLLFLSLAFYNTFTLGCLDAFSGFFLRDALFRKKILLCLAILETSPSYFQYFERKETSICLLFLELIRYGFINVVKLLTGILLFCVIQTRNFFSLIINGR
jgi:hypothetical protein